MSGEGVRNQTKRGVHVAKNPTEPSSATVYAQELPGCREVGLSRGEIEHFKTNGFIVKKGLLDSSELGRIVECAWEAAEDLGFPFDRNDPSTYTLPKDHGLFPDTEPKHIYNDGAGIANYFGGSNSGWTWRHYVPCTEDWLLERTARHPNMQSVVSQFLGDNVRPSKRCRGLYLLLPKPGDGDSVGKLSGHTDGTASQLNCMIYAADCPPSGGGFTLWPGSHRRCYYHMKTEYNWEPKVGYKEMLSEIQASVTPVEISGEAGDCCFWHPRSLHSAGVNTSSHLRVVVPCDFQKDKPTEPWPPYSGFSKRTALGAGKSLLPEDSGKEDGLRMQWWIDTREFVEPDSPPREDMWEDWAI
ncbi:MAG: hypothetical protein CME19_24635 [Gemmatimonadetes bacterium]|nr:hypothetical protein [Gemmatimonadota bacterium]